MIVHPAMMVALLALTAISVMRNYVLSRELRRQRRVNARLVLDTVQSVVVASDEQMTHHHRCACGQQWTVNHEARVIDDIVHHMERCQPLREAL